MDGLKIDALVFVTVLFNILFGHHKGTKMLDKKKILSANFAGYPSIQNRWQFKAHLALVRVLKSMKNCIGKKKVSKMTLPLIKSHLSKKQTVGLNIRVTANVVPYYFNLLSF